MGAFHYAKHSGNLVRKANGKVLSVSFLFALVRPEYSGTPLGVVHFDRSGQSDRNLSFHFILTNRFIALHSLLYISLLWGILERINNGWSGLIRKCRSISSSGWSHWSLTVPSGIMESTPRFLSHEAARSISSLS